MLISGAFRVSCVYSICSELTFERFLLSEVQSMNLFVTPPPNPKFRGLFLTSLLGANFDPRGELCPLGVKLSPEGEIICLPLHSSK
jgi:hypothetical protein